MAALAARVLLQRPAAGPRSRRLRELLNETTRWPAPRLAGLRTRPQTR